MKNPNLVQRYIGNTAEDALLALLVVVAMFLATVGVRSCYAHDQHVSSDSAVHAVAGHHS